MRAAALACAALLLAGCGGAAPEAREQPTALRPVPSGATKAQRYTELRHECRPSESKGLRVCERGLWRIEPCAPGEVTEDGACGEGAERTRATVEVRRGGAWHVVVLQPPGALWKSMVMGHWETAWLSLDGRTVLAQWSAECEVPYAFFAPASGGPLRVVTGEKHWHRSPASIARGWRADGRALVVVPKTGCSRDPDVPGLYAIDPETLDADYVGPASRP